METRDRRLEKGDEEERRETGEGRLGVGLWVKGWVGAIREFPTYSTFAVSPDNKSFFS